eukprot:NODE_862_length_3437_cov_1.143499.p3 type:complete len:220 gc:universal NODE_862_length_3437_cov_1.143499:3239-2580(-)
MNRSVVVGTAALSTVMASFALYKYFSSISRKKKSFDVEQISRDLMEKFSSFFPETISIPQNNKFTIVPYHQLFLSNNKKHFIHHSLRKSGCIEDMIYVYPAELDGDSPKSIIVFLKLGGPVCGYDGIVHGGLIAAISDDLFGALYFKARPPQAAYHMKNGVTANLNVNFRKPLKGGKWLIWVGSVEKMAERKTFLNCKILSMNLDIAAECSALFVIPKN